MTKKEDMAYIAMILTTKDKSLDIEQFKNLYVDLEDDPYMIAILANILQNVESTEEAKAICDKLIAFQQAPPVATEEAEAPAEEAPAEGETPAEGEEAPAEGETAPTEGETPAEGETESAETPNPLNAGAVIKDPSTTVTNSIGKALLLETTALSALAWMKQDPVAYRVNIDNSINFIARNVNSKGLYSSSQATMLSLRALNEYFKMLGQVLNIKGTGSGTL